MKNPAYKIGGGRRHRSAGSSWWVEHFRRDLQRDWTIPWNSGVGLSPAESERIAASIAEFQRGESSAARRYLASSAAFSERMHDPAFHAASKLFAAVENVHGDLLLRFMQQTGIPAQKHCSRNAVFRWLRNLGDLAWKSRIVLVAETVAEEYYPCLRDATRHPALMRLCDQIISEEAGHIRFQVERIVAVESTLPHAMSRLRDLAQAVVMTVTALAVYPGHRRVLSTRMGVMEFVWRVHVRLNRAVAAMRLLRRHAKARVQHQGQTARY